MLSWSISSAILILLVMALRAVIKDRVSPRLRYALWLLVLVRLLVPVSLGSTPISVLNAVATAETAVRGEAQVDTGLTAPVYPATSAGEDPAPQTPAAAPPEPEQSAPGAPVDTDAPREPVRVSDILLVLWAVGAAVTATVLVSMNLRFYEGLKRRRKLLGQFRGLPVYTAEGLMSPCLAGVLHPAVFITPELARFAVARTHILAHEYTHYRQRDHIWCALRCVCLALHWYNPLVWWAAAVSRRDCELSCDAGAVALLGEEARASYGRTLVSMVAQGAAPAELLRCATTMAGGKSAVKERVALLIKDPRTRATTLCVVAALLLVMAGCTFTGAMSDKENGLQALEDGFAAFEAAAESGDTFTVSLDYRGSAGWEAEDLYQFTDREAVLTLVERMRRCTWTYQGEHYERDMREQMGDMSLLFQSGRTGFTFYTGSGGTLMNYTAFAEDGTPTIRYYRAELPEDLRGQYDGPYDLFYETYLATCLANGGTPAGTDTPEYGFTTTISQENFSGEDGTELAYYDLSYPMAYVANEDALDGDTLAAARTVVQTFNGEMERRMEASEAELAGYTERLEGPVSEPWYVRVSSTVSVQGRLASATMLLEDFTGGAHPNYGYDSALFDLGAGQFIEPQSLGADPDAFTAGAAEVFIAYADGFDASFHADAWGDWQETVRDWPRTGSASFLEDGLHVYFDPYTLGPYSMGGVELFASYGDLWALFSDSGLEKLGVAGSGVPSQGDLTGLFAGGSAEGVPSEEEVGNLERLYGLAPEDVETSLGLTEGDYEANEADSTWDLAAARTMGGEDFAQRLLFTFGDAGTLYGVMYEKVAEDGVGPGVLERIYEEAVAAYSEPGTYPGLSNTISGELLMEGGGVAELGGYGMYQEQWSAGEQTGLTMRATVSGGKIAAIQLTYQMTVENTIAPIGSQQEDLLDRFVDGSIGAASFEDPEAEFTLADLDRDEYSVGERTDLDNDGEDELIVNGPYGGMYLDARDGKVYCFAAGEGTGLALSHTRYNGAVWIVYSNRTSAGYEACHLERYAGAGHLAEEMDLSAETGASGQTVYTLDGAAITKEEYDGLCSQLFPEGSGGQSAAPRDPRADMLAAYTGILELAFSGEPSPDDYFNYYDPAVTGRAELAQNRFAVCDVDGDGADELVIDYTTTYTPGMNVAVYGYDGATGEVRQELRDYRAATFYDNGYATVDASHNQGRNALDGDWWPYSLYRYDRETDTYQLAAVVDAWNREQAESVEDQTFPASADADGDGVVYYAGTDWDYRDPMDGGEYQKWVSSWQAGAKEVDIPWRDLTWDNVHSLQ